jgi:hypothetical protein
MNDINLYVKDVEADGNCFFYSCSDQIFGTTNFNDFLRERAIDFMKSFTKFFIIFYFYFNSENRGDFEPFLDTEEEPFYFYLFYLFTIVYNIVLIHILQKWETMVLGFFKLLFFL